MQDNNRAPETPLVFYEPRVAAAFALKDGDGAEVEQSASGDSGSGEPTAARLKATAALCESARAVELSTLIVSSTLFVCRILVIVLSEWCRAPPFAAMVAAFVVVGAQLSFVGRLRRAIASMSASLLIERARLGAGRLGALAARRLPRIDADGEETGGVGAQALATTKKLDGPKMAAGGAIEALKTFEIRRRESSVMVVPLAAAIIASQLRPSPFALLVRCVAYGAWRPRTFAVAAAIADFVRRRLRP